MISSQGWKAQGCAATAAELGADWVSPSNSVGDPNHRSGADKVSTGSDAADVVEELLRSKAWKIFSWQCMLRLNVQAATPWMWMEVLLRSMHG